MELGHRHIGFVAPGQPLDRHRSLRFRAYTDALKEGGLTPGPTSNETWDMASPDDVIHRAIKALLQQGPCTAIMAYNDIFAMVMLKVLADLNVHVPGDVSVTGFDDLVFARHTVPALTTVRIRRKKMGREAFLALNSHIATGNGSGVEPAHHELVIRASTASP